MTKRDYRDCAAPPCQNTDGCTVVGCRYEQYALGKIENPSPTPLSGNLKKLLDDLSKAATPGSWNPDPKRLTLPLSNGQVAQGPLMSYLVGDRSSGEGMMVSLASERVADHRLVAALVNAYRDGEIIVSETAYRWVSVEERQPAAAGNYIACWKIDELEVSEMYYWGDGAWTDQFAPINAHHSDFDLGEYRLPVTHWMPLPEAPK